MTTSREQTISGYADQITTMIDEDIAAGNDVPGCKRMPADVDSFTVLHDYRDANCYLLDLFNAHEIDSPGARFVFSDEGTDVCNAICDEVARRLAERAPRIRRQMAETVLFAIAAGFDGVYGEYSQTGEYFNADPDDFEVDDEDVDGAVAWLAAGRLAPDDWATALDAAENASSQSESDGAPGDAAAYSALHAKLLTQPGALTGDDLRLLSSALCLSIATCDPRCAADMPPWQRFAERVARMAEAAA